MSRCLDTRVPLDQKYPALRKGDPPMSRRWLTLPALFLAAVANAEPPNRP